jgi:multiple sugar transport system ATP-binding protein
LYEFFRTPQGVCGEAVTLAQVVVEGLGKVYPGGIEGVSDVDLTIQDGELFVIVGPSGSGKSTLLRIIAGLESSDTGTVSIGGQRVDALPPRDRNVAMVFQSPALYPYLSVYDNLAFSVRARRHPRREIKQRVHEVSTRLGLAGVLGRRPAALSGGERQRVALGRAIVRQPQVFLLDEPLSSLDAPLRASMRAELIDLHRKLGATMIHVTHDQAEALAMGDRIAVMNRGRIVQVGLPLEVYDQPANRFVAQFVGSPPMNLLPCRVEATADGMRIHIDGADAESAWECRTPAVMPGRYDLGIRPEHVAICESAAHPSGGFTLRAEVRRLETLGHETIATLVFAGHSLCARIPAHSPRNLGDGVTLCFKPARIGWFDAESGALKAAPSRDWGS